MGIGSRHIHHRRVSWHFTNHDLEVLAFCYLSAGMFQGLHLANWAARVSWSGFALALLYPFEIAWPYINTIHISAFSLGLVDVIASFKMGTHVLELASSQVIVK